VALTIGTQLGSHEITALLGKGGRADVYRAGGLEAEAKSRYKLMQKAVMVLTRILLILPILGGLCATSLQCQPLPNTALINGKWFNGKSFAARTVYSVDGRFTSHRPSHVDRTVDLAGAWLVPPFADAHNHAIGKGVEEMDTKAIQQFLTDGVFYVKIQGNLPMTEEMKRRLPINRRDSIDAIFAGAPITATGGHPKALYEDQLKIGYFPGYTRETLKDYTYFVVDSESDLDKKWPRILDLHPDFIKTILVFLTSMKNGRTRTFLIH
jgi:hypothetical protein